jgi:ATP-dependent Clp protease ATP-binding subunit ClpC
MATRRFEHFVHEAVFWAKSFLYLPYFWYAEGTVTFFRLFYRLLVYLNQGFALTLMLRLFFVPLFGDYSLVGRCVALIFRIGRILIGAAAIVVGEAALLVLFGLWLAFPPTLLWYYPELGISTIGVGWIFAFVVRLGRPHRQIEGPYREDFFILDFCEDAARGVVRSARDSSDLFERLLRCSALNDFLARLGPEKLPAKNFSGLGLGEVYQTAYDLAYEAGFKSIWAAHLITALLKLKGVRYEDAYQGLLWEKRKKGWLRAPFIWEREYEVGPIGGVNRGWTGRVTPVLDRYSTDLTLEAVKGRLRLMIGKEKPFAEVARVLSRVRKSNALLVGPPGSGKNSLVEGIAQAVIRGAEAEAFRGRRVIALDTGALVAGAKSQGELGERLQEIIKEIELSRGIILFVDEIHNLVVAGGEIETAFVFNAFRPHLATGKLQLIGATSWENYRKYVAPNEAFAQAFELVEVPAATKEESVEIIEYQTLELERDSKKTKVSFPAIRAAVEMSERLIYERVLPDKALDILEAAVLAKQNSGGGVVGEEEIAEIVAEETHIPVTKITKKEAKELLSLEERIHKGLINQEEAVQAVSDALRRARAGMREEEKPIASFLFVGPTGVGKTELSKILAEVYFGNRESMIRIDMSEFSDAKSIYRLIGSPPGAGAEEPGQLTEAVRQRPFSLILLDEFEKAHSKITNLFLQVFDDGRLTDGKGETVDFTNTIIIATSNAGTKFIQDRLMSGKKIDEFRSAFLEELRNVFPPELLNRFDGVMIFRPLEPEHIRKIVELKLKGVEKDLADREIKLSATPDFVGRIAELGYAPEWGARPLTRVIQNRVQAILAKKILAGEIKKGQTVTLDLDFLGS